MEVHSLPWSPAAVKGTGRLIKLPHLTVSVQEIQCGRGTHSVIP